MSTSDSVSIATCAHFVQHQAEVATQVKVNSGLPPPIFGYDPCMPLIGVIYTLAS